MEILKQNEEICDLEIKGLRLIQHSDKYRFTTDSVLLSDFAKVKRGETAADLGTGSGVIAILLAAKSQAAHIHGIELQPYMADMATRSVCLNGLTERITIHNADMREAWRLLGSGAVDTAVCNPPFGRIGTGGQQSNGQIAASRHELTIDLDGVITSAARLIKYGGRFYMIHDATRLADIMCGLRARALEPKVIRLVAPHANAKPHRVLIEAHSGGKSGAVVLPTLVLHNEDGSYTDEARQIYGK